MHPIERLRYVARAGAAPDRILVAESVSALGAFGRNPRAMLVAVRQLIVRQPESPGLLSLAAHMIQALEPVDAGWEFSEAMELDRTTDIAESIAISESGGTDVIDSIASGRTSAGAVQVACPAGTSAWIAHAKASGRSAVVVTPFGTRLPALLWRSYLERAGLTADDAGEEQSPMSTELLRLDEFDDLIGPSGIKPLSEWQADCPDVAEVARL